MLEFQAHDTKTAFERSGVSRSVAGLAWAPIEITEAGVTGSAETAQMMRARD